MTFVIYFYGNQTRSILFSKIDTDNLVHHLSALLQAHTRLLTFI